MPRDQAGALDAPLSRLAKMRSDLAAAKRREKAGRRRITEFRLRLTEIVLGAVIDGADLIAERKGEPGVFLLVALPPQRFRLLCEFGAAFEEDADDCALEYCPLDDSERDETIDGEDDELSDGELDLCDDEPNGDEEPDVDCESTLVSSCGASFNIGEISDEEALLPERRA